MQIDFYEIRSTRSADWLKLQRPYFEPRSARDLEENQEAVRADATSGGEGEYCCCSSASTQARLKTR